MVMWNTGVFPSHQASRSNSNLLLAASTGKSNGPRTNYNKHDFCNMKKKAPLVIADETDNLKSVLKKTSINENCLLFINC